MAKDKSQKAGKVPNSALYSRISFLHQAATYLASQALKDPANTANNDTAQSSHPTPSLPRHTEAFSRRLTADCRSVALKTQIRLSPALKHSMCKRCDATLISPSTCSEVVENRSRGGKKPWADVLLRTCLACGAKTRYPLSHERQKRRPLREPTEKRR